MVQDHHVKIGIFDTLLDFVFGGGGDHLIAGVAKELTLQGKHGVARGGSIRAAGCERLIQMSRADTSHYFTWLI